MGMAATARISPIGIVVSGVAMTLYDCAECGVWFALADATVTDAKKSGHSLQCPHGHGNVWHRTESVQQRELREARQRAERAEAEAARQRNAREWAEKRAHGANIAAGKAKAALKRTITRVHAGVCPHCNRTFKQLAAHMASKHGQERRA